METRLGRGEMGWMRPLRLRLGAGIGAEELKRIEAGDFILVRDREEADLSLAAADEAEAASAGPEARETELRGPGQRPRAGAALAPREAEILEYLAEGWSNEEIASVLGIGRRTVRFHLEGLYAKLGVSRRGEAVAEALRRGLLSLEF